MRARWMLLALLTISACASDPEEVDLDGDGVLAGDDCDDGDAAVHPGADEVCDGIDNDCDGDVDEGVTTTFYVDSDLDGFGDPEQPTEACDLAEGLSSHGTDCDDADPDTHPDAAEVCDERDNDCDDAIDEEVTTTLWVDGDGDGFGDPDDAVQGCGPAGEIVDNDDDCDDGDGEVHPDADEVCDEVDNDCDGLVDEDDAVDAPTWYVDLDLDGYGSSATTRAACEQPFGYVDNDLDCDDAQGDDWPGADEVCDGRDNDCDGTVDEDDAVDAATWYADGDEDGYGVAGVDDLVQCDDPGDSHAADAGDCDDGDAAVSPAATEVCDEVDNDCDGDVDEAGAADATTWYMDFDGDGYGNASASLDACEQPTGYVEDNEDCDDTDADIHPGGIEVCDLADNDCDGTTDEDDATDVSTWYADTDGDGYGDADTTDVDCWEPTGYVDDDTDCDDSEATTYPGADEYCDEVDNDCDGDVDEDDAVDVTTWYLDADGDGYGDSGTSTDSCDEPTGYVVDGTDCDDTDEDVHPATDWYYDYDMDGYGRSGASASYTQCLDPSSSSYAYSTLATDCDDYDATTYPGAEELCVSGTSADGIDNDCDGDIDEACPDVHCGTLSADETWEANTYGHWVTCNVWVHGSASPLLTIEDGASIEFSPGVGLFVGYSSDGDVDVQGTSTGVTMTSSASSPAPGDWLGLVLHDDAASSSIEGLTIEYGGSSSSYPANILLYGNDTPIADSTVQYSGYNGIYVYDAEPEISGTTIADNETNGLYCDWNSSVTGGCLDPTDGSFADNAVTGNGGYPVAVQAADVAALDTSSVYSGNGDDAIALNTSASGTVDETATWHDLGVPYYVDASIYVQDASGLPVLTLEDGVELYFDADTALWVGWTADGDLEVDGHTEGVLLSSAAAAPAAGDWIGVVLGAYTSGGTTWLDGATIEYGGGHSSYPGNVTVFDTTEVPFTDCVFSDSGHHGVYVGYQASAEFDGCEFSDNADYGLYLYVFTSYTAELTASFTGNTVTGNDWPVFLANHQAHLLDSTSDYSGNTNDYVVLDHGGYVSSDVTWQDLGVPYYASDSVYVGVAGTGATLTLEDGVDLRFDTDTGLWIGWASADGDLVIQGDRTTGEGVTLEAYDTAGGAGSWYGVILGESTSSLTDLAGFELSDAGGHSSYAAGVYLYYGTATLSDCLLDGNARYGVYMNSYSASYHSDLGIADCTIQNTESSDSTTLPDGDGLHQIYYDAFNYHALAMSDLVLTDNERYPMAVHANTLVDLDASSAYTGNGEDTLYVHGGYAYTSGTWPALDVDYTFAGDVYVGGTTSSGSDITADGITIYMGSGEGIIVGRSSYYGDLDLSGSTVTSASSTPAAGDWCGISFANYSSSASSVDSSTIEYGGQTTGCAWSSTYDGNLRLYYASASITGNTITDSASYGAYCTSSSGATFSGNTYADNASGDAYGCP